ncbi:MAG: DMT family transporter [Alphaproteobacteria bacterium]
MIARALRNPYVLLAAAALFWSGNHVLGRAIAGHVPPLSLSTLRWAVPMPVLFLLARPHLAADGAAIRAHWPMLVFLGVTGGALFSALQYVGLQWTTAVNVSVLNALAPVAIAAAAAIIFGDRLTCWQATGIAVSLAGVLVIVSRGDVQVLAAFAFNAGDAVIVVNMAIWAVYSAYLRKAPRMHWLSFSFVLATVSAIATAPFMAWEHLRGYHLQADATTLVAVCYVAVFPSVLAYAAWSRGVAAIGAARAGVFIYAIPIFSAVMATLFLGERLMAFHVTGFALIIAGVTLAARRGK